MKIEIGQYIIGRGTWGYDVHRVDALTPKLVKSRCRSGSFSQTNVANVVAVFDSEEDARKANALLDAARRHRRDDLKAAQAVYDAVKSDVLEDREKTQDRLIAMFAQGQIPEAV